MTEHGSESKAPQPPEPDSQELSGIRLSEPAPRYLKVVAWVWMLISVIHLGLLIVYSMLLVFSTDEDLAHRMLPEAPGSLEWVFFGFAWVVLIARIGALAAILRRDRAQTSVKVAWVIVFVSMVGHVIDAWSDTSRLTSVGDVSFTPRALGVFAALTLLLIVVPPVFKWFWIRPPEVVPFQTYYTEIALEEEIRQLKSGEAEISLPSVNDDPDAGDQSQGE